MRAPVVRHQVPSRRAILSVTNAVAEFYGYAPAELLNRSRERDVSLVRAVAMKLCRELTGASFTSIGEVYGRPYDLVIHGIGRIDENTGASCRRFVQDRLEHSQGIAL